MKIFFRNIHLYLSLAAGIVIAIVCFTGAVLVFEKEMQQLIYPERYKVNPVASAQVTLEKMVSEVQAKVSGANVSSVKIYTDPERTVEVSYKAEDGKKKEHTNAESNRNKAKAENTHGPKKEGAEGKKGPQGGGKGGNSQAFMNPYTGQIAGMQSQRSPFFFTMFSLHRWLLAGDTGKLIVGVSTTVFLFILITGIVLWWPQNKKILKQRLNLKWNAGWKRINHDLHIVVGFYTAIFLFAFAFTGLAWSFKWFNDGIYWITGSENVRPEPPVSVVAEGATPISFDQAYQIAKSQLPDAEYYTINRPSEAEASIAITVMRFDNYSQQRHRAGRCLVKESSERHHLVW
jgi:uncharacterized iron-regulated membrane protein